MSRLKLPFSRLNLVLLLLLWGGLNLAAKELPDYQVGDQAREEIVTPIQLIVIDPEETAALKQRESNKIPVLCRYYTNAANEAESAFRSAFATTQTNFLRRLQATFLRSRLTTNDLTTPGFQSFVAVFQSSNRFIPVNTNLAELWALGEPDSEVRDTLAAALREVMAHPLRPPVLPPEFKPGSTVRLVPLAAENESLTLDLANQRGFNLAKTNLITITRAREALKAGFPPEERALAKFLGSLLRTNCVPDLELTRTVRARHTEALWAADRYEPGQVLARPGQVIDKKLKAALTQLKEKTAVENLQQKLRAENRKVQAAQARTRWLLVGLGGLLPAVAGAFWWMARRKAAATSLLPVPGAGRGTERLASEDLDAGTVDLRERVAAHLARLMADQLVQRLLSQRTDMLDVQKKVVAEVAELEARLEQLQAPLKERLQAYEQRIRELEEQLAQRGAENRELLRAKIELVRGQLTAVRDRAEFN